MGDEFVLSDQFTAHLLLDARHFALSTTCHTNKKIPFHLRTKEANSRGTTLIPPDTQAALQRNNGRIPKHAYWLCLAAQGSTRWLMSDFQRGFPVGASSLWPVRLCLVLIRLLLSIIAILMIDFVGHSLARGAR